MNDSLTPSQRAALNTDIHISLTANAGSGKTLVLKKRYIKLLMHPDIFPAHIAAITFTEKAASELYTKIREELEETIQAAGTDDSMKRMLQKKKRLLPSAKISTIHSFCSELLREFAIEAETDPGFTAIDEIVSAELIEAAIDRGIEELFESDEKHDVIKELLRETEGYASLKSLLKSAINNRGKLDKFFAQLAKEETSDVYLGELNAYIMQSIKDILSAGNPSAMKNPAVQNLLTQGLTGILDNPQTFIDAFANVEPILRPEIDFAGDTNTLVRKIQLHEKLFRFNKLFSELFNLVLNLYEAAKYAKGYLDFEDLILKVRGLMSNPDRGLPGYLANKYKYIMIDEFQDTDEAQYDIFISDEFEKRGTGRNLFIVGDQKQSIYMFRNAEPEIFSVTQNHIQKVNAGGKLTLAESFRMTKELCAFINLVCGNMFSLLIPRYTSVEYEDLVFARDKDTGVPARIEILQSESSKRSSNLPGQARMMAARILQLKREKEIQSWGSVGILIRVNKDFIPVRQALEEAGIPFLFSGVNNQFNNQFTHDILNYFRFLSEPHNSIALTGILRSPFFMLSDSQLYSLFEHEGESLWEKLSAAKELPTFGVIYGILSKHLSSARSMAPSELFDTILESTDFPEIHSAAVHHNRIFALIENIRSKIHDFENESNYTLFDLIVYLESLIHISEREQNSAPDTDSSAVNIMTIHSSKGLQFNSVFLFNSNHVQKRNKSGKLAFSRQFGIVTPVWTDTEIERSKESTFLGDFEIFLRQRKEEEEIKRLYYVALTRAVDQLYILTDPIDKLNTGSLAHWVQSACNFSSADHRTALQTKVKLHDKTTGEHRFEDLSIPVVLYTESELIPESPADSPDSISKHDSAAPLEIPKKTVQLPDFKKSSQRILSVTSILMYNECPYRYKLHYDLRLSDLLNYPLPPETDENTENSLGVPTGGTAYGNIIHKGMELFSRSDTGAAILAKILPSFPELEQMNDSERQKLIAEYEAIVNSDIFRKYAGEDMVNEFDITAGVGGYFLNARIDSLILQKNSAVIIDYKTNPIASLSGKTLENYRLQLKIYAYLLTKLYSDLTQITTVILATRDPEKSFINEYSSEELGSVGDWLSDIMGKIISGELPESKTPCNHCILKEQDIDCTHFFSAGI